MLTDTRWRLVHDLGMELLEVTDPAAQLLHGLHATLRLVPADVAGDISMPPGAPPQVIEIPELLLPMTLDDPGVIFRSNPALTYLAEHGDLPASRVEDLVSPADWDRNPMRRALLEPNRVPHAVLVARRTESGGVQGWGVNRSRPFSDEEVSILGVFEGFLRRAAEDRERNALVIDLDHAVSAGAGLVLAKGSRVVHLNDVAAQLLERHQVPVDTILRLARSSLTSARPVGSLPSRHGVLRLRWRPALPGSTAVVLDEPSRGPGTPTLTTRQYAILCHLSAGLTAAAIGRQIGISERTVHKHLENLYRALAVADRLEAVLRGRELGLLPVVGGCGRLDGTVAIAP